MTLEETASSAPTMLTRATLDKIDAALRKVPVSGGRVLHQPPDGPTNVRDDELDPARNLRPSQLEAALHRPLPEQFIWTSQYSEAGDGLAPQYFRRSFDVTTVPGHATLYLAGPRQAAIYLNGKQVGHYQLNLDSALGVQVYECDVTGAIRVGKNVLAIEAVRGPIAYDESALGEDAVSRHLDLGEVLAAMIVPAARGIQSAPLVMSDAKWQARAGSVPGGWQDPGFNGSGWRYVDDLGGIESSIDLFQANADAGMYAWPGYDGISPFLSRYSLQAQEVSGVYAGAGTVKDAQALTGNRTGDEFTVGLPGNGVSIDEAPQLLLDFGREVAGRVELQSDSNAPAEVAVQYGESEAEALLQPYLGVDPVYVPPHGTARGPKSAFRYAVIRFTAGHSTRFRAIRLDGIAYPVRYAGSFESSDPQLNKIWAIGAYTAHLCMQDDIWDAPKRDRARYMGDLDVSGRTINDVFGDHFLIEDTLDRLIGKSPVEQHVGGIAGYSAFWVVGEREYYLHSGSMKQLERVHARLVELLLYMEKDLDQQDLFSDLTHATTFVDWSPGMDGYDAQTRMATQFEYYAAFRDGAYLLRALHDDANAARMDKEADALKAGAQKHMLTAQGTFGDRWQTNAYAVLSGVADRNQYDAIWRHVLSHVGDPKYRTYTITPYYNFYLVSALAKMGHRRAALEWIHQYWGGMVREGATSFWEAYDPSWPKGYLFQESLQADDISGFFVSLAHGWSSGVTPWLMTQVLGIRPTAGGFAQVDIRPDLIGLEWVKGAEPTPHGLLRVGARNNHGYTITIDLPPQVEAKVSIPVLSAGAKVIVNGRPFASVPSEDGKRAVATLSEPGRYEVTSR